MANGKNKYGQYMTPEIIANFMVSLADLHKNSKILEPCSGEGVFLGALKKQGYKNMAMIYGLGASIFNKVWH
jgi:adenine-specific DNA-methyltransferase